MSVRSLACAVGLVLACTLPAFAADQSMLSILKLEKSLRYQSGDVAVGSNLATLHLGTDYRFLDAADARKVIVDGWGNPPGSADDVLGMIAPAKASPLGRDSWGVVVSYEKEGHVDDADAAKIDYADLLKDLQGGTESANERRKKDGYDLMHLVGWARAPSYDAGAKKLIWAKELAIDGNAEHTLNYDVRVLGRRGVLSMNAVGAMTDLPTFETAMADVARHAEFNSGERYGDYSASAGDHMAAYGVAGLIAGGVAAKAGLFKGLLIAIFALKKFLIIGVIALVAGAKKVLGSIGGRGASSPATPPPSA